MGKKQAIVGLILFFVGAATFAWVRAAGNEEKQLQQNDQEKFKTKLSKLDEAFGDELDTRLFGNLSIEEGGPQEANRHKYIGQEETRELLVTAGVTLMLSGAMVLSCWLLVGAGRLVAKGLFRRGSHNGLRDIKVKRRRAAAAKVRKTSKAKAENDTQKEVKAEKSAEARKAARAKAAAKARAVATANAEARKREKLKEEKKAKAEAKTRAKVERKARVKAEKRARAEEKAKARGKREAGVQKKARTPEHKHEVSYKDGKSAGTDETPEREQPDGKKYWSVLRDSGWQDVEVSRAGQSEQNQGDAAVRATSEADVPESRDDVDSQADTSPPQTEEAAVLLSDEESVQLEESLNAGIENPNLETVLTNGFENTAKLEESLRNQTESVEKQVEELRNMAQNVQQLTLEHSKPMEESLRDLTEQVSAIREYASHQQERVKKLQDGYDWNIIRNFCLRVIRCIDNLESRIDRLSKEAVDTTALEEIRDELVFSLESNGIEQFEPEINSDYRGQEKTAEAVKDKEACSDRKQAGKIAEVIRPGYQYLIDEENVKVVRPAQVRLFG
jgi:molecular chaperone GrpE (heat shock protein)